MEQGDMIRIEFTGKAEGNVFDTTREDDVPEGVDLEFEPAYVLLGEGYVIEGLEEALMEMEVGDSRTVEVDAENGYGERSSENVETFPEKEFEEQGVQVSPGEEIIVGQRRGKVLSKGSGRVRVDFNHPLAGKDLEYDVEIVEKVEDDEEIAQGIVNNRIGHGEVETDGETLKVIHKHDDHSHELGEDFKQALKNEITDYTDFEDVEIVE